MSIEHSSSLCFFSVYDPIFSHLYILIVMTNPLWICPEVQLEKSRHTSPSLDFFFSNEVCCFMNNLGWPRHFDYFLPDAFILSRNDSKYWYFLGAHSFLSVIFFAYRLFSLLTDFFLSLQTFFFVYKVTQFFRDCFHFPLQVLFIIPSIYCCVCLASPIIDH